MTEESLADRMRGLKMREVSADDDGVERALESKASLAERMRAGPDAARAPAKPVYGDDYRPPSDEEIAGFAARLRALKGEAPADDERPSEAREEDKKKTLREWFLGREEQQKGRGAVTPMPKLPKQYVESHFYAVDPPYAFVRILEHEETLEKLYEVIEPPIDARTKEVLAFVEEALVRGLSADPSGLSAQEREDYLLKAVRQILHDYRIRIDSVGQDRVEYYVRRDFLGLGPIHVLMRDPHLEDVSCDGPHHPLFVYHRDYEAIPTTLKFLDDAELDGYVIRLAQRSGKAISISDPILDAALPDGSRLQATLGKEVTNNGSTFTIRRFKPDPFTAVDLVRFGTMNPQLMAWFWWCVEHGLSLIFSGGTASGKTTGLNAISQFIPLSAKVVTIEDTREVNLPHENWIQAITRSGSSIEGVGEIGMFELLKASLRQRPEYILVGEVRGIEATVAFQAMATGHTVFSTMHADSARSVVYRLENDPINIPRLVLQALDIIAIQAQVRYKGERVRRVVEVVELVGMDPSTRELLTNTVFKWDPATDTHHYTGRSYMLERIAKEMNLPAKEMEAEFNRRAQAFTMMRDDGRPYDVSTLTDFVKLYRRAPDIALQQLGPGDESG